MCVNLCMCAHARVRACAHTCVHACMCICVSDYIKAATPLCREFLNAHLVCCHEARCRRIYFYSKWTRESVKPGD